MKITVISDTHGSLSGWESAHFLISVSKSVIHCGDILNHGPGNPLPEGYNPKALLNTLNGLGKQVLPVKGNCDSEVDQNMLAHPLSYPFLFIQLGDIRLLASHGHLWGKEEMVSISEKWSINILITGHTHQWKIEKHAGFTWLNPGSPSLPKNGPSAALIDTEKSVISVYNLKTREILDESPFN
mgnify:CR=1 FL=1